MTSLRVLFISNRSDAPHRYRCIQPCQELRAAGALANVIALDDSALPSAVSAYSVVVLFRLAWDSRVETVVTAARAAGVPLLFDCDDLVFDPAAASLMPFRDRYSFAQWEQSYGWQLRALRRTFDACDAFLGSTPGLAEWARELGKLAVVHANVVPDEYVRLAPWVRRARPALLGAPTIGYFAGSDTHDRDLASIAPALARLLREHEARLILCGHVEVPAALRGLESRIARVSHVSYRVLPWVIAACTVTIAPLCEINAFTDGKSALKFFEAGIFGVPLVASPAAELKRAIDHGVSGWLARTDEQWLTALREALDPACNRCVSDGARGAVMREHTSSAVAGRLAWLLAQFAVPARGRAPRQRAFRLDEYSGRPDARAQILASIRRARELLRIAPALTGRGGLLAPTPPSPTTASERPARGAPETEETRNQHAVDIVVPVFNARRQTLRCLRSVIRHARGDFRLIVIDDASSDPELWPALERFAAGHEPVVLLRNQENVGFVKTCNRAMQLAGARDVVLLNSDTRVFRGFLRRLRRAAYADPDTGIVCPLSNNATICSVPEFCRANELPRGMSATQMARLVRRSYRARRPELVTPVGFCMYIRNEVLARVGYFDAERFGKGFGEENDLGERAKAAGFKIRLADDVYVWHEGKASFGQEGVRLEQRNGPLLEQRHPGYHAAVARFIADNPLSSLHDELSWHLGRRSHAPDPAPLFVLHSAPFTERMGGAEHVVSDLIRLAKLPRAVLAWPAESSVDACEVLQGKVEERVHHRFPLSSRVPRFCHEHVEVERTFDELLNAFSIGCVHVHHLLGWPLELQRVFEKRRLRYLITIHDYYCVCPSQNLLDYRTLTACCPASCGQSERANACLAALFRELELEGPNDLAAFAALHRQRFARILAGAARVIFPSQSSRSIVESVHGPLARAVVAPHGYVPVTNAEGVPVSGTNSPPASGGNSAPDARLRVALVGEISYAAKGAEQYLETLELCRGKPIEWHIFGTIDRFGFERRLRQLEPAVQIVRHGAYRRSDIVPLLKRFKIDVGLMLPVVPETFSLTLSELMVAGVFIVASRQGALVERLQDHAHACLVENGAEAAALILRFCLDRDKHERVASSAPQLLDSEPWLEAHRQWIEQASPRKIRAPKRRQLTRLAETRILDGALRASVEITRGVERHASAPWYGYVQRLKPYLPESLRSYARRLLAGDGLRTIRAFRLPGPEARLGPQLELDIRYLSTARLRSLGPDPCLFVDVAHLSPSSVRALRFNLWCSHPGYAYAQIFWRHEGDAEFTQHKSVTIPLNAAHGDWQEYVVRFDRGPTSSWYSDRHVVELRFDPVNFPGLICLGKLALCN